MNLKRLKSLWQQALAYPKGVSDIPIAIQGILIALAFGRLFYDSWIAVAALLPVVIPWYVYQKKRQIERNIRLIGIQFRDAISSVLTSLKAGYSPENAFLEAHHDMELCMGKRALSAEPCQRSERGSRTMYRSKSLSTGLERNRETLTSRILLRCLP